MWGWETHGPTGIPSLLQGEEAVHRPQAYVGKCGEKWVFLWNLVVMVLWIYKARLMHIFSHLIPFGRLLWVSASRKFL